MNPVITEGAFEQVADDTLRALTEALSEAEDDFEADLSSGVLTIRFEDKKRYVVNSHRAARQIWVAAEASAWHLDWNGTGWLSAKTGDELFALVRSLLEQKLRREVRMKTPAFFAKGA